MSKFVAFIFLTTALIVAVTPWLSEESSDNITALSSNFEARIFGNVPALCEGECTNIQSDILVDITGGNPPYSISIETNWNPAVPNNTTPFTKIDANSIHAFRICHVNGNPAIGISSITEDITAFNVPTNFFPGELTLISVEDSDGCTATLIQSSDPIPLDSGVGVLINYETEIPRLVCDSLVLPDIVPFSPTAAYYSGPLGTGLQFNAGEVLDVFSINLPSGDLLDSLYIFDPTDGCESEKLLPFMIQPSPNHNVPNDTIICGADFTLPAYSGPVTTPNAQYASDSTFSVASLLNPGDVVSTSQTIYLADTTDFFIGECTFLDSFRIEILAGALAGRDTTLFVCEGEMTVIPDPFLVLPNAAPGGLWSGSQIPDFDFNNPVDLNLSNVIAGQRFELIYTVEIPGCIPDFALLNIEGVAPPFAGDSTFVAICSADPPQDLFALANNPELGGNWIQTEGPSIFIDATGNVDFRTAINFEYAFVYTIPANGSCPAQSAEVRVELGSGTNAGDDNAATVCKGDSLELFPLLSSDAELTGDFTVDGFIPLPDGIWDSNRFIEDEGTINIQYTIPATSPNCESDTAHIVITLIRQPFAGFPLMATTEVCEGDTVQLAELLDGENPGGAFFVGPEPLIPIPADYIMNNQDNNIFYIVPGGGSCLPDTSSFVLTPANEVRPSLEFQSRFLCEDEECIDLAVTTNIEADIRILIANAATLQPGTSDTFSFVRPRFGTNSYTICNGATNRQNLDTIFFQFSNNIISTEIAEVIDECFDPNASIITSFTRIADQNVERRAVVCPGESAMIDGVEYFSSTVIRLESVLTGCDSIVTITIDTFPTIKDTIVGSFCAGTPQTILDRTFTQDTDEEITFSGQSAFGCDSIARVVLTFADKAVGRLDTTICLGDVIEIDGMSFSDTGQAEVDFLPGSQAGCDSSTVVSVIVADMLQGMLDTTICLGTMITIDGMVLMDAGTVDIPFVPGSAAGCDSSTLVTITLADLMQTTIDTTICDGMSIVIDGVTLDEAGTLDIPFPAGTIAGCDSSTVVNLVVQDLIQGTLDTMLCEGSIISIDGTDISEAGTIEIPFAAGSTTGCDSSTLVTTIIETEKIGQLDLNICTLDSTIIVDGEPIVENGVLIVDSFIAVPFAAGSVDGCDSTTQVRIIRDTPQSEFLDGGLCEEGTIDILGVTYDVNTLPEIIFIKNQQGCDSVALSTTNISIVRDFVSLDSQPFCTGDVPTIIYNGSGNFVPVDIFVNGTLDTSLTTNSNDVLPIFLEGMPGMNTVTIAGRYCTRTSTIDIQPIGDPDFNIISDELGDNSFELSSDLLSNVTIVEWSGSDLLDCNTCDRPQITIIEDTELSLTVLTEEGCEVTRTINLIFQEPESSEIKVYAPTAISLRESGNDVFFLQTAEPVTITRMSIFDRWGNLVFNNENFLSNESGQGWDGRIDSTTAEQGVYVYQIEYVDPVFGIQESIGSLTLIR